MNLQIIESKLMGAGCSESSVVDILSRVVSNIRAITYANESLDILAVYVVLMHTGGYKVFKTIRDRIVVDKMDSSFSDSRELVCLGKWNTKHIYRISFNSSGVVMMNSLSSKEFRQVLFSLVDPTLVKYVIGVEDGNCPTSITVDCSAYRELPYTELRDCIISSYKRSLTLRGYEGVISNDPSCYIVSYETA